MTATRPNAETMTMNDAQQQFPQVVRRVFRTRQRVVVEQRGTPVAAIVSTEDLARLDRLDAEWDQGFEVLDEIGAAFEGVDPAEIERETAKALAEVRADMRAEREDPARS